MPRAIQVVHRRVALLSIAAGLAISTLSHAAVITVAGANGANGVNTPAGTNAGPGLPATATTITPSDSSNAANATGGNGGIGGNTSGNGGIAGDATASATTDVTTSAASATAKAVGGKGGSIGSGSGNPGILGTGGNGGNATASGSAKNTSADAVSLTLSATGGIGGNAGGNAAGNGGAASIPSGSAISLGGGNITLTATAIGGNAGSTSKIPAGVGGAASIASLTGFSLSGTNGGNVSLSATAQGGIGGSGKFSDAGAGGSIALTNAVSGTTTGTLTLSQTATGGAGGFTLRTGSGGQGGNASSVLEYSDTLALNLIGSSIAIGGAGGEGEGSQPTDAPRGGAAGTALASIKLIGANNVNATAKATGGRGGDSTETFSFSADGGAATLGNVIGISTGGGNVVVSGTLEGGAAGAPNGGTGGSGIDATLDNLVDGATTGNLSLSQTAIGGKSQGAHIGSAFSSLKKSASVASLQVNSSAQGGIGSVPTATGGDAQAIASATNDAGSAAAQSNAFGQGPGVGLLTLASATSTASATTLGDLHPVTAISGAGGYGAVSSSTATATGNSAASAMDSAVGEIDSLSSAVASNQGNQPVSVSATSRAYYAGGTPKFGVVKGSSLSGDVSVSAFLTGGDAVTTNDGGAADLNNVVMGATTGKLTLLQNALGGLSLTLKPGTAGSASSVLDFTALDASELSGTTIATGGEGNQSATGAAPAGGAAVARANMTGMHNVTAIATAIGGHSVGNSPGGAANASAIASSNGFGGFVQATATATTDNGISDLASSASSSKGGYLVAFGTNASSPSSGGTVQSTAVSGFGVPLSALASAQNNNAAASLDAAPQALDVMPLLAANPSVRQNINVGQGNGPLSNNLAYVSLATHSPPALAALASAQTYSAEASMSIDLSALASQQNLLVGLLDAQVIQTGFDQLHFRVLREGTPVINQTFLSPDDALKYFQDQVIDLGSLAANVTGPLDLEFQLDLVSSSPDEGFAAQFLVANATAGAGVPEPVSLVWCSAGMLLRRRRRANCG